MTEYRRYVLFAPTLDSLWSRTFSPRNSAFPTLYQSFLFSIEFFLVLRWMRWKRISKPVVIFVDVVFENKIFEKREVKQKMTNKSMTIYNCPYEMPIKINNVSCS